MTKEADIILHSKFLSYVLRHHPEAIGLEIDKNGWVSTNELIEKAKQQGKTLDREALDKVIHSGSKQRFILSEDGKFIRAGYGHSIDVDLQLRPCTPPDVLYHGTAKKFVPCIREEGLRPGSRNFVHLSIRKADAKTVGARHGKPVILSIRAGRMAGEGHEFYQSESEPGIWLVKKVPATFLEENLKE